MNLTVEHWQARQYWVESKSFDVPYLVDMEYQEEPKDKPHPACDCWPYKNNPLVDCIHIKAVREHEKKNL